MNSVQKNGMFKGELTFFNISWFRTWTLSYSTVSASWQVVWQKWTEPVNKHLKPQNIILNLPQQIAESLLYFWCFTVHWGLGHIMGLFFHFCLTSCHFNGTSPTKSTDWAKVCAVILIQGSEQFMPIQIWTIPLTWEQKEAGTVEVKAVCYIKISLRN